MLDTYKHSKLTCDLGNEERHRWMSMATCEAWDQKFWNYYVLAWWCRCWGIYKCSLSFLFFFPFILLFLHWLTCAYIVSPLHPYPPHTKCSLSILFLVTNKHCQSRPNVSFFFFFSFFFSFVGSTGVWTQSLTLARQVLIESHPQPLEPSF
jgi:hypothetical protein